MKNLKPKKLKIKGLNSFIEEQVIDFDELTSKGLFGIFGPTGSGKSTILDAITMALYGKMSRGMDNYVNSSSDILAVSFDFVISTGGERRNYIAERSVKRDKNNNIRLAAARLYEKLSEDSINVIADGNRDVKDAIEKIIGLNFDDFSRSVVLPQGKFSEFLKIPPSERNNMLERLFGLEKYGRNLVDKINTMKKISISELDVLLGQIKSYEEKGITIENYNKEKEELKNLQNEEARYKKEKANIEIEYEKYKNVWELQQELAVHEERKKKLDEKLSDFDNKKSRINSANRAINVKPFLESVSETDRKIKENEQELHNFTENLESLKKETELTDREYSAAFSKKEKELPLFIKMEANLNQAIIVLSKIETYEKERHELLEKHKILNTNKKTVDGEILTLSAKRENIINTINHVTDRLNLIKVDPEFRQKVQSAYLTEKEYNSLLEDKSRLNVKFKEKINNINVLKEEYEKVVELQQNKLSEIKIAEEKLIEIEKNFPGDNNDLLKKQNEVSAVNDKYIDALKDMEKYKELQLSFNEINKNKASAEVIVDETVKALDEKNKLLSMLIDEKNKIEIMNRASIIARDIHEGEPCPVCGSIHHPNIASKIDENLLEKNIKNQKQFQIEIEELSKNLRKQDIELAKILSEETHLKDELKPLKDKLEGINIDDLEKEKNKKEEEFESLKSNIKNYDKTKNELVNCLNTLKEEKSNIDRKEAKLGESVNAESKYVDELGQELDKINESLNKITKQYFSLKQELNISSIETTMNEILKNEKETAELLKEEKRLRAENEVIDKKIEDAKYRLNQLELEIAKIVEIGLEKRRTIDAEKLEVNKLSDGNEPAAYIEIVRKELKEIKENEEKLRIKLQKQNEDIKQLSDKKISREQNKNTLLKLLEDQKNKLSISLSENQFSDEESVLKSIMPAEQINVLQNEISIFEDDLKNSISNIGRIKEKLQGAFIEEEKWQQIQKNKNEISELLDRTVRLFSAKNQVVQDIEKDFKTLEELEIRKKKAEHKSSLLDDLYGLVKGNSFVEFVAKSQLKYVAAEASKRLRSITRDRYDLEVDNVSGYFTIRDNFNGGTVRATSSLSGGETFLTSLSLALALSTQVQLKGSAPLEFFFLDEGFGTLDNELLETVMSSLERLHTERLSIGIISHVEELKNRVPIKLLVEPAENGGKGSRVRIELS